MTDNRFCYDLSEVCIMAILSGGDSYGYEINQQLLEVLDMSESTLYPILRKLEKLGVVESYGKEHNGRLRRYCKLTPYGKDVMRDVITKWEQLKQWVDGKFSEIK